MLTPWPGSRGGIVGAIALVVAVVALLWAVWRLWGRFSPPWDGRTVVAIIALAFLAGVLWVWWWLPQRPVTRLALKIRDPKTRADTEDDTRKTIGQALGGAGAAYLHLTQQRQASHALLIRTQVSKSFEQLGSKEIAIRLGGIYGLEGVMNTSTQYYQPVLGALCAFVREGTTHHRVTLTSLLEALLPTAHDKTADQCNGPPVTDIQAALTVIGRRNPGPGLVDLAGAHIPGAALDGANLRYANLERTHLEGAHLNEANLEGAALLHAHLEGAYLVIADLKDAVLLDTHFEGATLTSVNFEGASLWGTINDIPTAAHFEGADLRGAYGLAQWQIDGTSGDAATKLPEGLTRPKHWTTPVGGGAPAKP